MHADLVRLKQKRANRTAGRIYIALPVINTLGISEQCLAFSEDRHSKYRFFLMGRDVYFYIEYFFSGG